MNQLKDEVLLKEQMRTISKLQDKINLLMFDVAQLSREKTELKQRLKRAQNNAKNVRARLSEMKRAKDFSKINNVLAMLRIGFEDEE